MGNMCLQFHFVFGERPSRNKMLKSALRWGRDCFVPTNQDPADILGEMDCHSGDFTVETFRDVGPQVLWGLSSFL